MEISPVDLVILLMVGLAPLLLVGAIFWIGYMSQKTKHRILHGTK